MLKLRTAVFALLLLSAGLLKPLMAHATLYDRDDRAQRVARGERLPWNTLDDFYGYPAAEPDYRQNTVYSWAAALQSCFALAGYDTSQEAIISAAYGDDPGSWYFSPRNPPADVYGPSGVGPVHFHTTLAPGHLAGQQVIACIDHGSPVVLLLDDGLAGNGDPLAGSLSRQRYVTIYGYTWDSDATLPLRTLQVDVYDPLPTHDGDAGTLRLDYNSLAQAWAGTLTGSLVSGNGRLNLSRPGGR
jgi:hypothetical protein